MLEVEIGLWIVDETFGQPTLDSFIDPTREDGLHQVHEVGWDYARGVEESVGFVEAELFAGQDRGHWWLQLAILVDDENF